MDIKTANFIFYSILIVTMYLGAILFLAKVKHINLENTQLKQQIETTKQCLRNSQYEEWELCYEGGN